MRIVTALAPAWTTDWIAPEARRKLREARHRAAACDAARDRRRAASAGRAASPRDAVRCPRCGSLRRRELVALRLDGVQGAVSLQRLPRAVRLLQAALTRPVSKFHPLAGRRASSARRATRSPSRSTCPTRCATLFRFAARPAPDAARRHRRRGRAPLVLDLLAPCTTARCASPSSARRAASFSTWANDALRAGATRRRDAADGPLQRRARPRRSAPLSSAFAAGSGITPLLSIVKTTLAAEPRSRFTLFYGNRASATVMFRDELAALKDRYLDALQPRARAVARAAGHRAPARPHRSREGRRAARALGAARRRRHAFVCGPEGMMDAVRESLQRARRAAERASSIERFAASIPKHTHVPRPLPQAGAHRMRSDRRHRRLAARRSCWRRAEENILDAGLAQRHRAAVLVQGRRVLDLPLQARRGRGRHGRQLRARGLRSRARIHPRCQSYPVTDKVTVDFDQTGTG